MTFFLSARRLRPACLVSVLALSLAGTSAWASDAKTMMRDLDQAFSGTMTQASKDPLHKVATPDDFKILVRGFRFEAKKVPEAELKNLLKESIGKAYSLDELNELAGRIDPYYRAQGLAGEAMVPPQTVTDGIVLIRVLE